MLKKNEKIRVCIDFCDLKAAYPKDEFLLSITDFMIDNTCGFERMSFVDGFLGYNQIKMHQNDEKHTSFKMPLGAYYYTIMLFELKNVGVTYQHTMSTIFHDHLQKMVECYVDDIAVKSCSRGTHLDELRTVFNIMRAHKLKINPAKLFLGVSSDKFLGFIIAYKGIHLDLDKVKAIQGMQSLKTLKELRGL